MLVHPFDTADDTEREEVVVNIQGYLLRCNLPPITRPEQYVIYHIQQCMTKGLQITQKCSSC